MSRKLKQVISCQSFSPISDVRDGIIVTKDGKFVKLMEFSPINYGLRSNEDKNMITAQYAAAIRSFPSVVQIKVLSNRANVEHYISGMVESVRHEKNEGTRELMREQIDMMSEFGTSQGVSRRFFLAFQYEEEEGFAHRSPSWNEIRSTITRQEDAIRSNLRACGNIMISSPHDDVYVLSTLYDIMSRAQSANHPFDERMADVVARYTAANIDFTRDSAAHLPVNDVLAPYCIDTESSPRYIIVDGIYYMCCYLPSNAYPVRVLGGWMQLLAGLGEGIDVDVWLQKISPEKIQTALHHGLRFNAMRFRNTETTSSDYDDVKAAVDAGYYLKSSLAAGDEFAYMSTMLTITGESEREIDYKFKEIRRIFIERELTLKPCTFQQAEAFRSTIPVCEYDKNLFRKSRRNILCSDFASTYMFTSSELCDKDGVMLGVDDVFKSPVLVNFFDRQQYINANINIVGSSGSGKTFTTQVLALRMREKGVQTFIIAPLKGKEFLPLCEKVGGSFIEIKPGSGQNINIMEIRKKEEGNVYDDDGALVTSGSILAQKIQQLLIFFKLIIPDMTPEEVQYVDDALLKTYGNFGITHKNKSLLDPNDKKKYRKMPILSDVYSELEKMGAPANRLCRLLTRYTTGSASSFNAQTNVNLNNKFVVLDVSDAQKDFLPVAMFLALDYVWDKCKENRNVNKCVFIDETWRLVCSDAPIEAANFVVEIFRTIRGFGGSAVAATQNIADFFSAGIGTAIIGNAKIKMILRSEKEEANAIADAIGLTDEELKRVKTMDRGTCLLTANENHIFINVKATDTEEYLITTDPKARAAAKRRIEQKRTCAAFRR